MNWKKWVGAGVVAVVVGGCAISTPSTPTTGCKIGGTPAPGWVCDPSTDKLVAEKGLYWGLGSAEEMPPDVQKIVADGNARDNLIQKLVKLYPSIPQPVIKSLVLGKGEVLRVWRSPSTKRLYLLVVIPKAEIEKLKRVVTTPKSKPVRSVPKPVLPPPPHPTLSSPIPNPTPSKEANSTTPKYKIPKPKGTPPLAQPPQKRAVIILNPLTPPKSLKELEKGE